MGSLEYVAQKSGAHFRRWWFRLDGVKGKSGFLITIRVYLFVFVYLSKNVVAVHALDLALCPLRVMLLLPNVIRSFIELVIEAC